MKLQPNKPVLSSDSQPRHIGILAYPGVALLDAVGPLEVFAAANIVLAERSPPCAKAYHVEIWSERVGAIDGSCGVSLNATRSIAEAGPFELDTLIVAGSPETATSYPSLVSIGSAKPREESAGWAESVPVFSCWPRPACWMVAAP
jgi:transcriptional regulator GlxA family with amidase domain